jgi:hypothetical protein
LNRIFISYSGSRPQRELLYYALREHGLNPWRDVEDLSLGDDTTDVIEKELDECSGVLLWLNNDVFASAYVRDVELPALARSARRKQLRVVPIFDGMTPKEGSERVRALGFEVTERNGYAIDAAAPPEDAAAAIVRKYVRAHVNDAAGRHDAPVVRMVSYDDTAGLRDEAVLNIDWRHAVGDGALTEATESRLRTALAAATSALKNTYGSTEFTLAIKTHLPLAVAIGNCFAEPTGCDVRMIRNGDLWLSTRTPADVLPLSDETAMRGPIDARAATVELSISRDVEPGVNSFAAGHPYRERRMLTPPTGIERSAVDSPQVGNAWARQVGAAIANLADRGEIDRVDLFVAAPVELAVLTGWWTNATGQVDLMNWKGKAGPYERMWSLP